MSVRMLTKDLLALLGDHLLTASTEAGLAGVAGILIHTERVDEGAEPGGRNCLIGTSTNGYSIGHSWVEAGAGTLLPTLLPIQYVRALTVSLGKLLNKDNSETHVTDVRRDGEEIVIAEDPDLFGLGFTQRFAYSDLDSWPRGLFALLASVHLTPPQDGKPAENRTDFTASLLAPFLKIAARHGGVISLYRVHQAHAVHIQIGSHYRGLIVPEKSWVGFESADGQAPEIGVYAAALPALPEPEPADAETAGAPA